MLILIYAAKLDKTLFEILGFSTNIDLGVFLNSRKELMLNMCHNCIRTIVFFMTIFLGFPVIKHNCLRFGCIFCSRWIHYLSLVNFSTISIGQCVFRTAKQGRFHETEKENKMKSVQIHKNRDSSKRIEKDIPSMIFKYTRGISCHEPHCKYYFNQNFYNISSSNFKKILLLHLFLHQTLFKIQLYLCCDLVKVDRFHFFVHLIGYFHGPHHLSLESWNISVINIVWKCVDTW